MSVCECVSVGICAYVYVCEVCIGVCQCVYVPVCVCKCAALVKKACSQFRIRIAAVIEAYGRYIE